MKKKCAVFTIVKNESFFLPIWLKYYKKYFNDSDIYVLDHQSTDGSTNNLTVNVVPIVNELAFDHQWLCDTVQNQQAKLLEEYECVIFAESDELLYSTSYPLNELINKFLSDTHVNYITCVGHEVIQNLDTETPMLEGEELFKKRNYWFDYGDYDKTLISKIPLTWIWGFHLTRVGEKKYGYDLHMAHLHRCDFELMLKRHEERANKWKLKDDGAGVGFQHRIGDRDGVLKYFNKIPSPKKLIPQEHKNALNGI
jgi:hypothetical protein